jgi:hypothetical protein
MLLKLIALFAAALPIILFVRAMFFRRPTRVSEGVKEFKKQVDFAIWMFMALVGCLIVFAFGKIAWAWWTSV